MTQDELAERLFVTRQTVSNYETGKSRPDIEMLTRIAETLDTDPNTVIYGIPQQLNTERRVLKLCISAAVLVIAVIGFGHLTELANELGNTRYDMRLSIGCRLFGGPILAFLFGWTAMQALGVFAKLSPLAAPWGRRLRWGVLGCSIGYLLLMMPMAVFYIMESTLLTDVLPDFLEGPWTYAAMWMTGYYPVKAILKPNVLLCGILGCALWLGIPDSHRRDDPKDIPS